MTSAVANCGGLGMIPLGNYGIEQCEIIIDETQALTDKSIGANLILEWDQRDRLALCLKKGIKLIWFFWGVVDAFENEVPVVAAGGTADGQGLAAALTLGAQGAVVGAWLLSSHEAGIHEQYKERIIYGKGSDTVYTDLLDKGWTNLHMRVLRNSSYDMWLAEGKPEPGNRPNEHEIIVQFSPKKPVERYSYYLPSPVMKGNLEPLAHYAG